MEAFIGSIIRLKKQCHLKTAGHIGFLLILCLSLLSGCSFFSQSDSTPSDPTSSNFFPSILTPTPSDTAPSILTPSNEATGPYKDIFALLEQGNYREAEEIIQSKVLGNVREEENALNECADYAELLIDFYNNGKLPLEDVSVFIEAVSRTSFASYFEQANLRYTINQLAESKENYAAGVRQLQQENPDYESAIYFFLSVLPNDSTFADATNNLNMIMEHQIADGQLDSLRVASETAESLAWKMDFFIDAFSGFENQDDMRDDWIQAQFLYAQALEANYRYAHAIRQYSRLKDILPKAQESFTRLLRQKNKYTATSSGSYCIDEKTGLVTRTEDGMWIVRESGIVQLCIDTGSFGTSYLAVLHESGIAEFTLGTNAESTFDWLPTTPIHNIIKILPSLTTFKTAFGSNVEQNCVLLDDSGRVSVYGALSPTDEAITGWSDLVDIWYINVGEGLSGYIGLTAYGRVLTTCEKFQHISLLYNIISVSCFYVSSNPVYVALSSDGTVYCSARGSQFQPLDETDIVAIAGPYALKADGTLKELLNQSQITDVSDDVTNGSIKALFPLSTSMWSWSYLDYRAHALTADGESILLD